MQIIFLFLVLYPIHIHSKIKQNIKVVKQQPDLQNISMFSDYNFANLFYMADLTDQLVTLIRGVKVER